MLLALSLQLLLLPFLGFKLKFPRYSKLFSVSGLLPFSSFCLGSISPFCLVNVYSLFKTFMDALIHSFIQLFTQSTCNLSSTYYMPSTVLRHLL